MKTVIHKIWIVIAMLCLSNSIFALDFAVDGIFYNILSETDRTLEVTRKSGGYSGDVEIPKKLFHHGYTYTVTSIGNSAFADCYALTSVTIPNSVTSIGDKAFYRCGLTSVTIPYSVTSIGEWAFWKCSSLTSVNIPNSVTSIGVGAFSDCSSLTSVTIPNSVTSIGNSAFYDCSALTSVTIPNSVTSIGNYAFSGCSSLTSVNIPHSVTSIGDGAFSDCLNLGTIDVNHDNTAFCSKNGILYNKGMTELLCCPGKMTSVTIPTSVTSIGNYAFDGCSALTSVIIPNSVTSIGEKAFYECSTLTSVTIPNSVTSIGNGAFQECDQLDTIYSLIVEPFTCGPGFSYDNYKFTTLYVPKGSLAAYERVDPWRNFWNIEENNYASGDGIISGAEAKTEVGRYNLQGLEVGNDYKDIVIIRYSDGSCCKQYSK